MTEAIPLSPERIVIPEQPPVEATSPAEPAPEKKVVRRVVKPTSRVFTTAKASRRKSAFAAVLLLGLVWYLVAVMFGGSSLGRAGGWVLVTISTMMVVAGSVELFVPKDRAKMTLVERPSPDSKPQEVLICPKCHRAGQSDRQDCPDCGRNSETSEGETMMITWHGHSCFEIKDGVTVVTDPHDGKSIGVKPPVVKADIVLISHEHFDHNCARIVRGESNASGNLGAGSKRVWT